MWRLSARPQLYRIHLRVLPNRLGQDKHVYSVILSLRGGSTDSVAGSAGIALSLQSSILTAGSYAYPPAKAKHSARCANAGPCVLFIAFESPIDAMLVEATPK